MNSNTETIVDENGIEILVGYDYEELGYETVEGHGFHVVGGGIKAHLTSVELIIAGRGINFLPQLTEKEKDFIISKLTYEG